MTDQSEFEFSTLNPDDLHDFEGDYTMTSEFINHDLELKTNNPSNYQGDQKNEEDIDQIIQPQGKPNGQILNNPTQIKIHEMIAIAEVCPKVVSEKLGTDIKDNSYLIELLKFMENIDENELIGDDLKKISQNYSLQMDNKLDMPMFAYSNNDSKGLIDNTMKWFNDYKKDEN